MLWLLTLLGLVLLAVLCLDVYATVFVPTGQPGPLSGRLYRRCWHLWHRRFGDGSTRSRHHLARVGPLLVPLTVLVWAALLWLGFTMVLVPWSAVPDQPRWFTALYVSGYSITTLGTGDITPAGRWPRVLMVLAAASGFVLISVAVTYLLSVYAALARMTALAFEIHRFMGRSHGLNPGDVLVTVAGTGAAGELSDWLASTASSLAEVVQADDEFPMLHYFHFPDERALPVALSDLLEVVTLCRTVLSPAAFPALTGGLVVAGTERVARRERAQRAALREANRSSGACSG
ncbi:potassium channel family protein [Deinococcus sp.]|uniref:potassium channel family protein n=1 Tax=Deinococcus sp. TaxID=47478 RepID=UPI00391A050E